MMTPGSSRVLAVIGCLAAFAPSLVAQTTIQLFNAVDTRLSESTASYSTPDTFNTTTLNLTCSTSPVQAILSGPLMNNAGSAPAPGPSGVLQPGGNLLVDNNIIVTVTPAGGNASAPANACTNAGDAGLGLYNRYCFTGTYEGDAQSLIGQDPDTYQLNGQTIDAVAGVPPIDLGTSLAGGFGLIAPGSEQQSVAIALADEGTELTSSTIFLTTNCTLGGVTGPATVTGNTISTGNTSSLTQTFNFNTGSGQQVGFVYNLSGVSIFSNDQNSQAIPQTTDEPLDPTAFQPDFVQGTSFATSNCLIHTGELLAGGGAACKLYTLECTIGTGAAATGAQCPVSAVANEVVDDIFDGPTFSLQDIPTTVNNVPGPTFHEGIGFLMASEAWGGNNPPNPLPAPAVPSDGGPCVFDALSGLESLPCPLNLLTSFSGPGSFDGEGETRNPNSTFVSVYGVPEDLTTVTITNSGGTATPLQAGNWTNNSNIYFTLSSQPPVLTTLTAPSLPGVAGFVASPIQSITYGLSTAASVPAPISVPIASDTVLTNISQQSCPPQGTTGAAVFAPTGVQNLSLSDGDGNYLLHYYAEDCAGTRELQFANTASNDTGTWSTNFYTFPINLDTVAPVVASGPTLSPSGGSYTYGQPVSASFSCTDDRSGVVNCGGHTFAPGNLSTGTLTSAVPTSTLGNHQTFTVTATDAAGNQSSQSVSYTVLAPTVILTTTTALTGSAASGYTETITVKNAGTGPANSVQLTSATLGSAAGTVQAPTSISVPAGGSGILTVTFSGSAGSNGAGVAEKYAGTYAAGSFSASVRSVTLP
jgi:hypothetical protein